MNSVIHAANPTPIERPIYDVPQDFDEASAFVGRDDQLATLRQALLNGKQRYYAITGAAGMGKTALALKLAWDEALREHFTGGILWLGMPLADVASTLDYWLEKFHANAAHYKTIADKRAALQQLIADKRILFIFDYAEDIAKVKDLIAGGQHCRYLLTCQSQSKAQNFAGEAQVCVLKALDDATVEAFLQKEVASLYQHAQERLLELVQGTGKSPLALHLIVAYLYSEGLTHARVAHIAGDNEKLAALDAEACQDIIKQVRDGVQGFQEKRKYGVWGKKSFVRKQEASLHDVILASARRLSDKAWSAFCYMGAFAPAPADFAEPDALAVMKCTTRELDELVDRFLLQIIPDDEDTSLRYSMPVSVAAVAREHMHPSAKQIDYHWEHYVRLTSEAYLQRRIFEAEQKTYFDEHDTVPSDAYEEDFENLRGWEVTMRELEQIKWGWQQAESDQQRFDRIEPFWLILFWQGKLALLQSFLEQLEQVHLSNRNKAYRTYILGYIAYRKGDIAQAKQKNEAALALYKKIDDRQGEAIATQNLGEIAFREGDIAQAKQKFETALALYQEVGDRRGEAVAIRNLGEIAYREGDIAQAKQKFEAALALYQEVGARRGEAIAIRNLGDIAFREGDIEQAKQKYETALALYQEVGARQGEAIAIRNLGEIAYREGDIAQAKQKFETALALYQEIGARQGEAVAIQNLGDIAFREGDIEQAKQKYETALALFQQVGNRHGEAQTIRNLGEIAYHKRDIAQAKQKYETALALYQEVGARQGEAVATRNLGEIAYLEGDIGQAKQKYKEALELFRTVSDKGWAEDTERKLQELASQPSS